MSIKPIKKTNNNYWFFIVYSLEYGILSFIILRYEGPRNPRTWILPIVRMTKQKNDFDALSIYYYTC